MREGDLRSVTEALAIVRAQLANEAGVSAKPDASAARIMQPIELLHRVELLLESVTDAEIDQLDLEDDVKAFMKGLRPMLALMPSSPQDLYDEPLPPPPKPITAQDTASAVRASDNKPVRNVIRRRKGSDRLVWTEDELKDDDPFSGPLVYR